MGIQADHDSEYKKKKKTLALGWENHSQQELSDKTSNSSAEDGDRASDTFTLSDKIHAGTTPMGNDYYWINDGDVKEFIKRLKSNIEDLYLWEYNESVMKEIDKIFGDKLT